MDNLQFEQLMQDIGLTNAQKASIRDALFDGVNVKVVADQFVMKTRDFEMRVAEFGSGDFSISSDFRLVCSDVPDNQVVGAKVIGEVAIDKLPSSMELKMIPFNMDKFINGIHQGIENDPIPALKH